MLQVPMEDILQFIISEEIFLAEELADLTRVVLAAEARFATQREVVPAAAAGPIAFEQRIIRGLTDLGQSETVLLRRLEAAVPRVARALHIAAFKPTRFDLRVSVAEDGYQLPLVENAHARISFVCAFWRSRELAQSTQVRIHEPEPRDGHLREASRSRVIPLQANHVVFFPSRVAHAIVPLERPATTFADSRFLLHGWIGV